MTPTPLVRLAIARWLPVCALLVLAASCKKYRADRIQISGYRTDQVDMTSTDTFSVTYRVEGKEEGPADFEDVNIQSKEATISADFQRVDSLDGDTYIRLNFYTRATPSGSYPVKAIVKSGLGAFTEITTTITVVNYLQLLRSNSTFSNVGDSLDEYPFSTPVYIVGYTTAAQPLPNGPTNAYRFSRLGIYPAFGNTSTISNVTVYVDSVTGRLTAPLQPAGGSVNYQGSGQLMRTDGYVGLRGTFNYDFYTQGGTHYQGRLVF
jgi:hypothetical protein